MYNPDKSGRKTGGGHNNNIAQIYTDTKQDMELCEILDLKQICHGNPGHQQC